ncbi:MAG: excisionase family DNA-binding protein [Dehalogenimonas sp.]
MQLTHDDNLLTVGEVASILCVAKNTIRRWTKSGFLSSVRMGPRNDRFFGRSEVEGFLKKSAMFLEDFKDNSEVK